MTGSIPLREFKCSGLLSTLSGTIKPLRPLYLILLLVGMGLLVSCAHQPMPEVDDAPGFLLGLWNGFTILFALIGHIFDSSIRIYAFPNSGGWYDFGFFLGALVFCGGAGSAS
jgi:hypothetical protein